MNNIKHSTISLIARIGYVAKGVVYFVVGLLALQIAVGVGSAEPSTKQAVKEFLYQPFGSILLVFCIVGLLSHALWRVIQGLLDPEERGSDVTTILFRSIDFFSGLLYISLSYAAWQILSGLNTQSSDQSTEIWIGKILDLPYGSWIVMFCALVVAVAGIYQFYSAYTASFDYNFDKSSMSEREVNILQQAGRIGITAWGVVYCMISFLFYSAAVQHDRDEAGGLADALNALSQQPYGLWILAITAGGLLAYGVYLLILSYYHKI